MRMLDYVYLLGIIGVILAYAFLHLNIVWIIGYLVILFITDLMPKKMKTEAIIAIVFLGAAIGLAYSGATSFAALVSAFLLLATGLPGIIIYAVVTVGFHSYGWVQSITLVSESILSILIVIHIVRYVLTHVFFVAFWVPILDIIPITIDAALIVLMIYLVIGTGNGSVLYSTIQNGVNALLKA